MGQIANPGRNAIERDVAARRERQEMAELRSRYALLTPRERDVLAGILMGRLNKQIAADLGTSEVIVKEQREHVMQKMRVGSVAELVRVAARLGVTPTPSALPRLKAWASPSTEVD